MTDMDVAPPSSAALVVVVVAVAGLMTSIVFHSTTPGVIVVELGKRLIVIESKSRHFPTIN